MNQERLLFKGQLATLKNEMLQLNLEASSYIILLRTWINPYIPLIDLNMEIIISTIQRLNDLIAKIKEIQSTINELENHLYG